jgi:hypothetical protein
MKIARCRIAELTQRHDRLEAERAQLAQERRREALLAAVLSRLGEIVLCALPLVLAWYLLHCLRRPDHDPAVSQILIEEILSEQPRLFPRRSYGALVRHSGNAAGGESE